jgi:hypothetical protein
MAGIMANSDHPETRFAPDRPACPQKAEIAPIPMSRGDNSMKPSYGMPNGQIAQTCRCRPAFESTIMDEWSYALRSDHGGYWPFDRVTPFDPFRRLLRGYRNRKVSQNVTYSFELPEHLVVRNEVTA